MVQDAALTATRLQQLATIRLAEARLLYGSEFLSGAWYLGGYAVELALKAVVCRNLGVSAYPERAFAGRLKSHSFSDLALLAGLTESLLVSLANPIFERNWELINTWDPQQRYEVGRSKQQVSDFLSALDDREHGVYVWLSNRW